MSDLGTESILTSTFPSFLRNDVDTPLPVVTGSRPVLQPNWGYEVARRDLRMLQPLHEIVQQLLCEGLMGANLLRNFFSH
jgi:hypothetical protein